MRNIYSSWMLIREKLVATIGQDPNVYVHEIKYIEGNKHCIVISVIGRAKAEALRVMIPNEYQLGNISVYTVVEENGYEIGESFCGNKGKQVANTICIALQGNYLFEAVALPEENSCILPTVYVLIVPKCIRVWEKCGVTFEELAANLFAEVLKMQYGYVLRTKVIFTMRHKCKLGPRDIYCLNHQMC